MEEPNTWIEIGKLVGVRLPRFGILQKRAQQKIVDVQNQLLQAQSEMMQMDIVTNEALEYYSLLIQKLQQAVNRQSEYFPLMSLNMIMSAIKRKIRLRSAIRNNKNILITANMIQKLLINYLDKPYGEILKLALFELEMIIEEVRMNMVFIRVQSNNLFLN